MRASRLLPISALLLASLPLLPTTTADEETPVETTDTGCAGLCWIEGNLWAEVQRSDPCTNFYPPHTVCYIIHWYYSLSAASLEPGIWIAQSEIWGSPEYTAGACSFLSPLSPGCSTSGYTGHLDIRPPNSTTCHSWDAVLRDSFGSIRAGDFGTRCVSVGG